MEEPKEPKFDEGRCGTEEDDEVPKRELGGVPLVVSPPESDFCQSAKNTRESVIIGEDCVCNVHLGKLSEVSLKISAITDDDSSVDIYSLSSFTANDFVDTLTAAGPHQLRHRPALPTQLTNPVIPSNPVNPTMDFITVETTEKHSEKIQTRLTVNVCDKNSKCDQPNFYSAPKSPVTVQDWVDSIDLSNERTEVEVNEGGVGLTGVSKDIAGVSHELEDNLGLGAEALHLQVKKKDESKSNNIRSDSLRKAFRLDRENSKSLNSETSTVSISSVEAFLETMRDDPEEILANLGFGSPVSSPLARIPKRFLVPSQVKGNDLHDFIEKHEEMQELFDMGFSGYRGLSGICMDGHSPSGIVSKILEKIRDRNNELKRALTITSSNTSAIATSNQPPTMSFFNAAFSVMAVNAFRNAIRPGSSNNSILEPENRQFLDSQDELVSNRRKKRPRLVIGKHSFTVDTDEELIDDNEDVGIKKKPSRKETPDGADDTRHAYATKGEATNDDQRPPLIHSMSDEVFLPAENKPRLWNVVRSTAKASKTTSCDTEEATIELTPQTALATANAPESTSEKEKSKVVMGQCHSSRLNRLTRQISIHEELKEKSLTEQQHRVGIKLDSMKSIQNKDSFELEELPTGGDFQDDDWQGTTDRKGLQTDSTDIPRTGSAMSDSSGFQEGETLETVMDIIDEVSMQITSIDTPMQALESDESPREDNPPTHTAAIASEIMQNEDTLHICTTFPSNEIEDTSTQEKVAYEENNIVQTVVEDCDTSVIFNCDHVGSTGYLSESDTIVAIESSSSGDNQPTSAKEKPIEGYKPSKVGETHKSSTYFDHDRQQCFQHHHRHQQQPPLNTSLAKSRSEANLSVVYTSPTSHYQRMGTSSSRTSLENISSSKIASPQSASRVGSDCYLLSRTWNRNPENLYTTQIPRRSQDISTFHESCKLTIERMQDVLKLYTKQLRDMERSCWETHNRFFPGMTKDERDELKKLSDLRRYILEEVNRTQVLLGNNNEFVQREDRQSHSSSSTSQCKPYLINITNQLEVLIKCQRDLSNHFLAIRSSYRTPRHEPPPLPPPVATQPSLTSEQQQQSQVKQMFDQIKHEILQEVKTILQNDHLRFQEELQKTRSGIEEVQQTVNQLLSIIQAVKSS